MNRRINWPLWIGLLLSIVAFFGYVAVFARYPLTRDVPWASWLLFAIAIVLLIAGVRRAQRKVLASIVAVIGIGIAVLFTLGVTVMSKQLPHAAGAPAIGQRVPDFTLPDANRRSVTLSQLLATPGTNGVLLVFYRGYW
jgi:hypothetical protein